jgi:hypothetical protein
LHGSVESIRCVDINADFLERREEFQAEIVAVTRFPDGLTTDLEI